MKFLCPKCNKLLGSKQSLQRHTIRNACRDRDWSCAHCKREFTTETAMYKHVRESCQIKREQDEKTDKIYKELSEKIEKKYETRIEYLEKMVNNDNNQLSATSNNCAVNTVKINTKIINEATQNNCNIILVGHGEEDYDRLDMDDVLNALRGFNTPLKLLEMVNFNPEYPEYHNILVTNIKDNYVKIFDGNEWKTALKEEVIESTYDNIKCFVNNNIEDFVDLLSPDEGLDLRIWLNTDDRNKKIIKIKKDIFLMLYNKAPMIQRSNKFYSQKCVNYKSLSDRRAAIELKIPDRLINNAINNDDDDDDDDKGAINNNDDKDAIDNDDIDDVDVIDDLVIRKNTTNKFPNKTSTDTSSKKGIKDETSSDTTSDDYKSLTHKKVVQKKSFDKVSVNHRGKKGIKDGTKSDTTSNDDNDNTLTHKKVKKDTISSDTMNNDNNNDDDISIGGKIVKNKSISKKDKIMIVKKVIKR